MRHRTSLPVLSGLLTLLLAFPACSSSSDDGDGGGGNGGNGGNGGSGGSGASTSSGGGTNNAGGGGEGGGDGGSGPVAECQLRPYRVSACVLPSPLPPNLNNPQPFSATATVTAVRVPSANEPCEAEELYWYRVNHGRSEVMLDLTDTDGNDFTVGVAVPGFTAADVAVGDVLEIDFQSDSVPFGGRQSSLRIERDGALLVAAAENRDLGFGISDDDAPTCVREGDLCTYREFDATVEVPGEPAVSIPSGETTEIGDLTITNDRYFKNYDSSGGCNFGLSIEYVIGAVPTSSP
ncbi:hypothetical protein [Chondromyces crocatus]|uniref:Secreted protein n=1 Tax=Chondromyces crocatus TaxID=52 RepID=A0A0K1EPH4_CHOCO|nr:hypothetical protein [Chondromyces crocatus]AKT42709.1 uncharacterized protein CMC5_069360 [Chondromyces crocatus]